MKHKKYIVYGEAVYGPFPGQAEALNFVRTQGWFNYEVFDNATDAQLAVEAECDR